jgi:hypothetical protein
MVCKRAFDNGFKMTPAFVCIDAHVALFDGPIHDMQAPLGGGRPEGPFIVEEILCDMLVDVVWWW